MHGGKRSRKKKSYPEAKKEPKGPQPVNLTTDCAQEVNQKNSKLNWTKKTNSPQGSPVRSSQTGQAWGKTGKPVPTSQSSADFPSLGDSALSAQQATSPAPDSRKRQDEVDIRNIDNWDTTHDLDFGGSLPLPACPSDLDEPERPTSPPVKMDANSYNHHSTNDRHANNRRFSSPRTQQPSGRRDRFQRDNYSSPRSNDRYSSNRRGPPTSKPNDRYSSHNRRGPPNSKPNLNKNKQKLCSDLLFEDELPDAAMQPQRKSSQDIRNKGKTESTQKSSHDSAPQSVVHQHIRHDQEARRNQEKGKFGGRKDTVGHTRHGRGRNRKNRDFGEIDLKEKPWHRNQRFPESTMFPWSKKSEDFQRHQQLLTDQERRVETNFDMVRVQLRNKWQSDRTRNEKHWSETVQELSESNKQNNNEIQRSQNWRKGRGPVDHRDKQEDESLLDGIGESAELKNTKHKKGGRQKGRDDKKSTKIVNSSGQTKWEASKTKAMFGNQPNQRTDEPHLNKPEVSEIIQTQSNEPDSQEHSISLLQIRQDQQILDSKNPRFPRRNSEPVRTGQTMVQPQWPNDPSAPEMYTQQSAPAPNMHQNQQLHLSQPQSAPNQTPGQPPQPFPPLYNHIRAVPQTLPGQQGQRIIMMQRTVVPLKPGFPQMGQPNANLPTQGNSQPQPNLMRLSNGQFMVAAPNLTSNPGAQYVHKPANVPFLGSQPQVFSGQPPFIMTGRLPATQQQGQIANFNNNNAQEPSAQQQAQALAQAQAAGLAQVQMLQAQQQLQFQQMQRNQYPAQNPVQMYNLPANMNAIAQPVQPQSVHTPPPMNPTSSSASTPGLNPNANEFIPNS